MPLLMAAQPVGARDLVANHHAADAAPEVRALWDWSAGAGMPLHVLVDSQRPVMYVAAKQDGVRILSLQGDSPPAPTAALPKLSFAGLDAVALAQQGSFLYVALGDIFAHRGSRAGLATIDVSDCAKPKVVSFWQSAQNTSGSSSVLVDNGYLYLGAMARGVFIFDLKNPHQPRLLSSFQPDPNFPVRNPNRVHYPNVRSMAVQGGLLFVCYDAGGLRVLDISDKLRPREVSRYINTQLLGQQQAYNGIVIDPPYAFLTCDYAGVEIVDVSDATNVKQLAWWDPWRKASGRNFWFGSSGHANQIELDRARGRLFVSAGDSELLVLDVKDPSNPRLCARYGGIKDGRGAWGVTFDRGIAYLSYIKALIPFRSTVNGIKALDCRQ